jgi:altronate dehydratase
LRGFKEDLNSMKLIRFGEVGQERPGVLLGNGVRIDVSMFVSDYSEAFFGSGRLEQLRNWLEANVSSAPQIAPSVRLGPPICRPSKIVCIGLNFRDHAAESKMELPREPVIFFKSTTSLTGPNDPLVIPKSATKVDWEVELAVVIGKRAREDSNNLCGLIAGYIHHPNVAGATVLSLGCQHAQIEILRQQLHRRNPNFDKPLIILEQQQSGSEFAMLSEAIQKTFLGLVEANKCRRGPAPLSQLCVGLKCGGSDGFSGISANPAIGHTADLLVALGGRTILSEFPELCGVEQELMNRSTRREVANRFAELMRSYHARAEAVGSGFEMNPCPGNIRDGLITDAMKSAGAAKKGGTSPVTAVLDYPEYSVEPGLHLQCTPGNDVECVTAQVGAGASLVLFTTGLGTPTGNPIAPVVKLSTNSNLAQRMGDIIDIDTGGIISGTDTIEQMGEEILELVIKVASGEVRTKAELNAQNDFIPWKRGVSL